MSRKTEKSRTYSREKCQLREKNLITYSAVSVLFKYLWQGPKYFSALPLYHDLF